MQQIETDPYRRLGPVRTVAPRSRGVDAWEAFIAPGDVFRHPREVVAYPGLSVSDKRAILASWASDARAVDSCPGLRCLQGAKAEPVPLDSVLAALQALDGSPAPAAPPARPEPKPDPASAPVAPVEPCLN